MGIVSGRDAFTTLRDMEKFCVRVACRIYIHIIMAKRFSYFLFRKFAVSRRYVQSRHNGDSVAIAAHVYYNTAHHSYAGAVLSYYCL